MMVLLRSASCVLQWALQQTTLMQLQKQWLMQQLATNRCCKFAADLRHCYYIVRQPDSGASSGVPMLVVPVMVCQQQWCRCWCQQQWCASSSGAQWCWCQEQCWCQQLWLVSLYSLLQARLDLSKRAEQLKKDRLAEAKMEAALRKAEMQATENQQSIDQAMLVQKAEARSLQDRMKSASEADKAAGRQTC